MPKKKYSAEYKAEAVKLVQSGERSQAEVCRNLGISSSTISQWCKNVTEPAVTKEESAKVKALEAEIRRLKLVIRSSSMLAAPLTEGGNFLLQALY